MNYSLILFWIRLHPRANIRGLIILLKAKRLKDKGNGTFFILFCHFFHLLTIITIIVSNTTESTYQTSSDSIIKKSSAKDVQISIERFS